MRQIWDESYPGATLDNTLMFLKDPLVVTRCDRPEEIRL